MLIIEQFLIFALPPCLFAFHHKMVVSAVYSHRITPPLKVEVSPILPSLSWCFLIGLWANERERGGEGREASNKNENPKLDFSLNLRYGTIWKKKSYEFIREKNEELLRTFIDYSRMNLLHDREVIVLLIGDNKITSLNSYPMLIHTFQVW